MLEVCSPHPIQPLFGLLAERRGHLQHRASPAATLAIFDAFILALLAHLLRMVDAWHPIPFPSHIARAHGAMRPCHARAPALPTLHPGRPSRTECHLVRILYVLGPAPQTGMRPLPSRIRTLRHRPPIRPPPDPPATLAARHPGRLSRSPRSVAPKHAQIITISK